jgi:hypothetical protein
MTTRTAEYVLFSPRYIFPGRLATSGALAYSGFGYLELGCTAGRVASGGFVWALGCVFTFFFLFVSFCICRLRRHMVLARPFGSHRSLSMSLGGGGACLLLDPAILSICPLAFRIDLARTHQDALQQCITNSIRKNRIDFRYFLILYMLFWIVEQVRI